MHGVGKQSIGQATALLLYGVVLRDLHSNAGGQ